MDRPKGALYVALPNATAVMTELTMGRADQVKP